MSLNDEQLHKQRLAAIIKQHAPKALINVSTNAHTSPPKAHEGNASMQSCSKSMRLEMRYKVKKQYIVAVNDHIKGSHDTPENNITPSGAPRKSSAMSEYQLRVDSTGSGSCSHGHATVRSRSMH